VAGDRLVIVVALVPAYNSADRIAETVASARTIPGITRVLVIDDGSTDRTGDLALGAGAEVLVMPTNAGKSAAIAAGVAASPDAEVFLLLDADLAGTAVEAARLLPPVVDGDADLAIAVLPDAAGRAGFGAVRNLAARGIERATGWRTAAPLSGQRAVKADHLRTLTDAHRFGLEVAMTIDALRAGARVVEVEAPIEHRHTGRSWRGFAHRGRQGLDVLRALWPRLTSHSQRIAGIVLVALILLGLMVWSGTRWEPTTQAPTERPTRVVIVGLAPYDFTDIRSATTPNLDRMRREGAVGAMTVRTVARRPSVAEGYLSLGAGARLRVAADASLALPSDFEVDGVSAREILARSTGTAPDGSIAAIGAARSVRANTGVEVASPPGALADALAAEGIATGAVGVSDRPESPAGPATTDRPAVLAAMTSDLDVQVGNIDTDDLLVSDPSGPYGVWSDTDAIVDATLAALDEAGLVVIDPGDLYRAATFRAITLHGRGDAMRDLALARTDALIGRLLDTVGSDTLVLAVSVTPRSGGFRLTPVFAAGPGVPAGSWITSPSTKRTGLSALTDVAPTVLDALTGAVPTSFPGNPFRYESGPTDLDLLTRYDRDTNIRERTYFPQAQLFIAAQAFVYAGVALVVSRQRHHATSGAIARWAVLAVASYPAATFAVKALPWATASSVWVPAALAIALAALLATVASRRRGHPLAGFEVVLAATVAIIVIDAATGTRLHVSSWLGYSLHSAGRFYGMPNTTFAVLGAATILLAVSWCHHAHRHREAVAAAGAMFAVVTIANGAPFLGGDVGGIITFVPVFGLTLWALAGRRIRLRTLVVFGVATVVVLLAAAGIDLLRPAANRTHLGRFADQMLDEGFGPLIDTFLRKQGANLRIFRVSIWTWMIPIVTGFILYLLAWGRGWERVLPPRSALRIGAVSVMSAALLGFAANDSGPIVIALFFVYLLPFLALLVLHPGRERVPVLHAPSPAGAPR
jgi:hypothetical protein